MSEPENFKAEEEEIPRIKCTYCPKDFKNSQTYQSHIEKYHLKDDTLKN